MRKFIAFNPALRYVIFVANLGLEHLTNAFGISSILMGASALLGISLAGTFKESTNDFIATFAYSGFCLLLSGVVLFYVPKVKEWELNKDPVR